MYWQNGQLIGNGYPHQIYWNGNRLMPYPNQGMNFSYGFVQNFTGFPQSINPPINIIPVQVMPESYHRTVENQTNFIDQAQIRPLQSNLGEIQEQVQNEINETKAIYCSCSKSGCIKQYCLCFKNGATCSRACRCSSCKNTRKSQVVRPTIKKQISCSCRKIGCRKKYCECFSNGKNCSRLCECFDCENGCI